VTLSICRKVLKAMRSIGSNNYQLVMEDLVILVIDQVHSEKGMLAFWNTSRTKRAILATYNRLGLQNTMKRGMHKFLKDQW